MKQSGALHGNGYAPLKYLSSFRSTAVIFLCLIFQTGRHLCLLGKDTQQNFCFIEMLCQYIATVII